jgi:hypothetical protein
MICMSARGRAARRLRAAGKVEPRDHLAQLQPRGDGGDARLADVRQVE